jgi:predicted transposase YbfD/YdcC
MNTSFITFQDAIQRQDRHAHTLSAFATQLEDTLKKYIDTVPKLNLINQGTQWFLDQQQRQQAEHTRTSS